MTMPPYATAAPSRHAPLELAVHCGNLTTSLVCTVCGNFIPR